MKRSKNILRPTVPRLAGFLALTLLACTGKIPGSSGGAGATSGSANGGSSGAAGNTTVTAAGSDGTVPADCASAAVGSVHGLTARRVRRLSRREYGNVVADLLGATAQQETLAALPDEPTVGGFDNQNDALFVSPSLQENLADLAAKLATESDPAALAPCATTGGSTACLQTFIRAFANKAYGRPLTDAEFSAASALGAQGQDYATQVRLIVEMMLQSPHTLYASELGPEALAPSAQPVPLTPYEVASQLSLLLTGARPDAALLTAAQAGALSKVSDIQAQVQRLLPTARGQAALSLFINGWLDMGPVSDAPKSADVYPEYTATLGAAMQQEFDQFVTTQLNGGNGTLSGFMTATSHNVPAALASVYGSDLLPSGPDPKHRAGILSLPALLTYVSSDVSSGPIQRGLLVRRQLLCQTVPPPPPDVLAQITAMPVDTTDTTMTTRQKFENHLTNPSCSACHASFDPLGFGFEDMDGLGRFRSTEHGLPVDSTGHITGTDVDGPFEGPADLSVKLAASKDLAACMVSHFFSFAQSRDPGPDDQCVLQDWNTQFASGGGRINDLINAYISQQNFVYRKDDR